MKVVFTLCLCLVLSSQARAVEVLTSIKPLQLIASAITEGTATPKLLLPPGSSPHDYALRPSDVRKIKNADLVIWVGPELEVFLAPLLASQEKSVALLSQLPAIEHAHHHDKHSLVIEDTEQDSHHHHHGSQDPHIWLDPHQAEAIAALIAKKLSQIDPQNYDRYQTNLAVFQAKLAKVDAKLAAQLAPLQGIGYFVFHDAYGHWERHYQLSSLGHFTVNPARAPGAKTVTRIHHALKQSKAVCVFAEPQFKPAVVSAVLRNTQARSGVLDPLATDISPSAEGYFRFMEQLAAAMTKCLLN
ncbi:zinc ABC transporter substrate-binding protein ZnuA [Oceanisphaera avium]|uniref:High-affinity zinc uptake system protein ZnuA n=1 Tax=Oceanisphaera avium TaxID=1903694 RepID=A0A1Y0CYU1_9GAMM|nr:zinc ABC transporter substrate-binding protein ZnuA [Oceanisphaera avium]ART79995.1 zinc ABC transporter substrate-binding protein [Oceanisphaera avium]